jgi:LemA protein
MTGGAARHANRKECTMSVSLIVLLVLVAIIVGVIFFIVGIYNRLVSLRNRFKNAFSQIDVQLTRRHELIPNLVETAKAYMAHERGTLEDVIKARNQAITAQKAAAANPGDAEAIKGLIGAETALTGTLGKLFALSESYPDLKADKTMTSLMEELSSTENKVAFSRQAYNDSVMTYNTFREQFPNNMVSNSFGFTQAQLFELEDQEYKKAVKVSF